MTITLYIPAIPVAQPRVRATMRGRHAGIFNPDTIKNPTTGEREPHPIVAFKATVRHAAHAQYKAAPLTGPVRVDCLFVFPRPAGSIWKKRPMPRYRHTGKPDRDNLDKAVLDSLKGIILADDCLACDGRIQKWVRAGDEQSHVVITITTLENP